MTQVYYSISRETANRQKTETGKNPLNVPTLSPENTMYTPTWNPRMVKHFLGNKKSHNLNLSPMCTEVESFLLIDLRKKTNAECLEKVEIEILIRDYEMHIG